MPAPEVSGFGDAAHESGETGLVIDGAGFGFAGTAWIYENADRTGAADQLTIGDWNDIQLTGVEIPAVPNNVAGTRYLVVEREDLAYSLPFPFAFTVTAVSQAPFWGAGLNKVFRFVAAPGTETIDFTPFWTDPQNDAIVEYQLDFSESDTDVALPAGWSFDTATGLMTVNIATAGVHTDWIMTAEDALANIGTSATFDIVIVVVQVVTFRFEMS